MPPIHPTRRRALLRAAGALALGRAALAQTPDTVFWAAAKQPGTVLLMRHAQTEPGIGDPPGLRLGDCSSQRNLSEAGRIQARAVGKRFAAHAVAVAEVRTSAWCRGGGTAELTLCRVQVWSPLNSFFNGQGDGESGATAVLAAARSWRGPGPLVLVTHQVNISRYTGEFTAMGELLAVRHEGGRLRLLARLPA